MSYVHICINCDLSEGGQSYEIRGDTDDQSDDLLATSQHAWELIHNGRYEAFHCAKLACTQHT